MTGNRWWEDVDASDGERMFMLQTDVSGAINILSILCGHGGLKKKEYKSQGREVLVWLLKVINEEL